MRRREGPADYESDFRAHGSNQRFRRPRATLTYGVVAPSLAGVRPAATKFSSFSGDRARGRHSH
jgi:hypothetical protein